MFVAHSTLYADLQTHYAYIPANKNFDLLPKSWTAETYLSRLTF